MTKVRGGGAGSGVLAMSVYAMERAVDGVVKEASCMWRDVRDVCTSLEVVWLGD
jgi:hypothetical protein